jgi:hypothetical protein
MVKGRESASGTELINTLPFHDGQAFISLFVNSNKNVQFYVQVKCPVSDTSNPNLVRLPAISVFFFFLFLVILWWRGFLQNLCIIRAGKLFFLECCFRDTRQNPSKKSFSGTNNAFGRKPRNHKMREQEKENCRDVPFYTAILFGALPFYCCDTLSIRISFSAAALSLTACGHFIC